MLPATTHDATPDVSSTMTWATPMENAAYRKACSGPVGGWPHVVGGDDGKRGVRPRDRMRFSSVTNVDTVLRLPQIPDCNAIKLAWVAWRRACMQAGVRWRQCAL